MEEPHDDYLGRASRIAAEVQEIQRRLTPCESSILYGSATRIQRTDTSADHNSDVRQSDSSSRDFR